jgi:plastocyanin domain-containing protein
MNVVRLALLAAFVLAAPAARAADKAPRTIELAVTDAGLAPQQVKVAKGEALRLGITRKTDKTCMLEVVIADTGTKQQLPLNKTVYVDFTPAKAGNVRILCGMGMEFGKLVVN